MDKPAERTYKPIWDKIKAEGSCTIKCAPSVHKRVAKAVKKEKCRDQAFKDVAIYARLEITSNADKLTFKLYGWIPLQIIAAGEKADGNDTGQ